MTAQAARSNEWTSVAPLSGFVRNDGQWDPIGRFLTRSGNLTVRCEVDGVAVCGLDSAGDQHVSRIRFGKRTAVPEVRVEPRPEKYHFCFGSEPTDWFRDVASFDEVVYPDVFGAADVRVLIRDGRPSYDVLLESSSDVSSVEFLLEGAMIIGIDGVGNLLTRVGACELRHVRPVAYEADVGDGRSTIACEFRVIDANRFGFHLPGYEGDAPLVIDPGLEWSTLFGGSIDSDPLLKFGTTINDVLITSDRDTLIVGGTGHLDFPTTVGAYSTTMQGKLDAYLTRVRSDGGALEFSTFFGGKPFPFPPGGGGSEIARAVVEDPSGSYLVGGETSSADYPITPGAYFTPPPFTQNRAFATRFSADGSTLLASSLVGAGDTIFTKAMAVSSNGDIALAVESNSGVLPSAPVSYDTTYNGGPRDAAFFVLSPDLTSLKFASFFGTASSTSFDQPATLDLTDDLIIFGAMTDSVNWPVTPDAIQPQKKPGVPGLGGEFDATLTAIDRNTGTLVYSTYLGTTNWSDNVFDSDMDAAGNIYLTGRAVGADYVVTPGAYQSTVFDAGNGDAFITCFDKNFDLVYSTYFGWFGEEYGAGIRVTGDGFLHLYGQTDSGGLSFPGTPGAHQPHWSFGGSSHLFCARLDRLATRLDYMTGLGGSSNEKPVAIDVDDSGAATLTTYTSSPDFPTTPGAFDQTYTLTVTNTAITRLDLLPTGVTKFGTATPGCAGASYATVNSWPKAGSRSFAIQCARSPKNAKGVLVVSPSALAAPLSLAGTSLWVNPNGAVLLSASSNGDGIADVTIPIRPQYAGTTLYTQFLWPDPCGPAGYSSSNALQIVAQP